MVEAASSASDKKRQTKINKRVVAVVYKIINLVLFYFIKNIKRVQLGEIQAKMKTNMVASQNILNICKRYII